METQKPLIDLQKTAKDLTESNNHVIWEKFRLPQSMAIKGLDINNSTTVKEKDSTL